MRKRPTSIPYLSEERGVALILTLGILVLVTLLVIAFAVSMRVENTASKNFNDLVKARQLAQAAVDQAVATIGTAAQPITPATNYVTAPGVIYTLQVGLGWRAIPLFTLYPQPPLLNTGSADLNQNNVITGTSATYPPGTSQLWVGWSNVVDVVNAPNQLVGRFAYWVDDESAKVNLNVAGTRLNDLEGYTPAAIDLRTMPGFNNPTDQIDITNYVATVRPLDTIASVQMTGFGAPSLSPTTFTNDQFYMTVSSTSPDVTPWGDKRLNLTGVYTNNVLYPTTASKVQAIVNMLQNLNLTTWYGSDFSAKYPSLPQIAANILDYIDTDNVPTDNSTPMDQNAPLYLGLEQTPYLNELVISNAITASGPDGLGNYTVNFSTINAVELWYMYTNANWTAPAVGITEVVLLNRPGITITPAGAATANGLNPLTLPLPGAGTISVSGSINPGGFGVFTVTDLPTGSPVTMTTNLATIVLNSGTVTAIFRNQTSGRIDYAVIPVTNYTLNNIDLKLTSLTNISWISACNDPRVKPVSNTWTPSGVGAVQGTATLGTSNTVGGILNYSVTTGGIQGDGDNSCHIVSGGTRDKGIMYPGELGFIHTGVPWHTFSLQPQPSAEVGSKIPDWALLDLFSATDTTNVIGRINVNSIITNANPIATPIDRLIPLDALLTNTLPVPGTSYNLGSASGNIYNYQIPPNGTSVVNPPPSLFSPFSYTMVGEVANTPSLSNTTPGSKRDREAPVRGIANLITTRSNTFTIWALAQSIKKIDLNNPSTFTAGKDLITGETKVQVIVERTVDTSGPTPQVKFRTLYYRYLYN